MVAIQRTRRAARTAGGFAKVTAQAGRSGGVELLVAPLDSEVARSVDAGFTSPGGTGLSRTAGRVGSGFGGAGARDARAAGAGEGGAFGGATAVCAGSDGGTAATCGAFAGTVAGRPGSADATCCPSRRQSMTKRNGL